MCWHEFYRSTACGHHFPKLPPSAKPNTFFSNYHPTIAVPQSLTCTPVKLALKFYHDQVVYLPADMNCGAKVDMPEWCPIVHTSRDSPTKKMISEHQKACTMLNNTMLSNGLGLQQVLQTEVDAAVLDQCSNRSKPGQHSPAALRRHKEKQYPLNMYAHVQSVKAYQQRDRRHMVPNVLYTNVNFGCGGPFSAECLTGWDGAGLLTHRLHLWGDAITHPQPCNDKCLVGWSGADLDTYRQEVWQGYTEKGSDRPENWTNPKLNYSRFVSEHVLKGKLGTGHWYAVDYSSVSHLHADQFHWNGHRFVRKNDRSVRVPETVVVPVPERLDQVLRGMNREPEEVDRASIEDILGRLPEAFEEEEPLSREHSQPRVDNADDSEGASTLVDEPVRAPEQAPVETPEMAEARRQRARKEMREKIARDFSKGKGKMTDEEETGPADSGTAQRSEPGKSDATNPPAAPLTGPPNPQPTQHDDHPPSATDRPHSSPLADNIGVDPYGTEEG